MSRTSEPQSHVKQQSLPLVHELMLPVCAQNICTPPPAASQRPQGCLQTELQMCTELQTILLQHLCHTVSSLSFRLLLGFWPCCCRSIWGSTAHPILFSPCVSECLRLSCAAWGNSVSFGFGTLFLRLDSVMLLGWSYIHNLRGSRLSLSGSWEYIHVTLSMVFDLLLG